MLFARLLKHLLSVGHLKLIDAYGKTHEYHGDDMPGAGPVTVRLTDPSLHWKLALHPRLYVGEAYMDGTLVIEQGTLYDFLALCAENLEIYDKRGSHFLWRLFEKASFALRWVQQHNPADRSKQNVAHHYDLSSTLYELFLDRDRQYSCAYFPRPGIVLEDAQDAKKRHIAAKLLLKPGQRVLDIGCGWGGMALTLARLADVEVLGVTLSEEQLKVARQRAEQLQLSHKVKFELIDYRSVTGKFDRIVSVGMFEHVGVQHYPEFFAKVDELLTDDGVAVLHSIGRYEGPGSTNAWIRKYIFPGGYSPALSEVLPVVEKRRMFVTDVEILRLHYAETLKAWRERFHAAKDRVSKIYDERFFRMWDFYLAGSETAFRHMGHIVFQLQMAKRVDTVPLTRDYIYEWEHTRASSPAE
jgi:cyclopropane-fatty-acyl-phospholipid synthase